MTDMKKAEGLETIKTTLEHIQRLRSKREEIVYMYDEGGPILWVSSGAVENSGVDNQRRGY